MIKINRPDGSEPDALRSDAARELRRNRKKIRENRELNFKVYSSLYVKDALNKIFNHKCAFCDSKLHGAGDVEHYRPKGKIHVNTAIGIKKIEGYYWLAASWDNLLISCIDCNQRRKQLDEDGITWKTSGKGCFFPLENEDLRASGPRSIRFEKPLLINPCIVNPDNYLILLEDGSIKPIIVDGSLSQLGKTTIEICGLTRFELLQARAERAKLIKSTIRHIVNYIEQGKDPSDDIHDLLLMLNKSAPYLSLARSIVKNSLGAYIESLGIAKEL